MKRILVIAAIILTTNLFGQGMPVPSSINVTEAKYAQDGQDKNAFDVVLQGTEKEINSAWSKFLSDKYDFKLKSKSTTTSGEELMSSSWSDKRFAIESGAIKDASGTHIRLWVFFGPDIIMNSTAYPTEAANVKAIMKDFAKAYYIGVYNEELADQSKIVTSQGKEVTGLAEDKVKTEKAISKAEAAIVKAEKKKVKYQGKIQSYESKIVSLDGDIQKTKKSIENKKSDIKQTSGEMAKESEKYESVEAAQKKIKEKIAAIERL
jgi:hypothetical protein|tara:strand:+ start:7752 stop:8543 length:792 start_codon:yes stop_codon:yes gene_type:complete